MRALPSLVQIMHGVAPAEIPADAGEVGGGLAPAGSLVAPRLAHLLCSLLPTAIHSVRRVRSAAAAMSSAASVIYVVTIAREENYLRVIRNQTVTVL
jgi:hypothetical protein